MVPRVGGRRFQTRQPPLRFLRRNQITVRAPGVAYQFDPTKTTGLTDDPPVFGLDELDGTGRMVTIGLTRINKDQKVTVTLR